MPCGVGPCAPEAPCPFGQARVVPEGECCSVCQPVPSGGICDPESIPSFFDTQSAALGLYSCQTDSDCTLRSLESPCGPSCETAVNANAVDEYLRRLYEYARTQCVNCGAFGCSVALECPLDGSPCYPGLKGERARCVSGRCMTAEVALDGGEWIPGVPDAGPSGHVNGAAPASQDCPPFVPKSDTACGLQSGNVCYFASGARCQGYTTAVCQDGFWIVIPGATYPCDPPPPPPPPPPTTTCPPAPGPIFVEPCNYQGPPCSYGGECPLETRIVTCDNGMWSLGVGPCRIPPVGDGGIDAGK